MNDKLYDFVGKWVIVIQNYRNSGLSIQGILHFNTNNNTFSVFSKDYFFSFCGEDVKPDNDFEGNTIFLKDC